MCSLTFLTLWLMLSLMFAAGFCIAKSLQELRKARAYKKVRQNVRIVERIG